MTPAHVDAYMALLAFASLVAAVVALWGAWNAARIVYGLTARK